MLKVTNRCAYASGAMPLSNLFDLKQEGLAISPRVAREMQHWANVALNNVGAVRKPGLRGLRSALRFCVLDAMRLNPPGYYGAIWAANTLTNAANALEAHKKGEPLSAADRDRIRSALKTVRTARSAFSKNP